MSHYIRMRFKKNNKANRGVKVNILEKAITNDEFCICPTRIQLISNGQRVIPLKIKDYLPFCPAHKGKAKSSGVKL